MSQIDQLSVPELVELRDAINARLGEHVSDETWELLESRIAIADADPQDYIRLEDWKNRRRTRRSS